MIRFLSIKRLAVIDAVDLELGAGLTVLTGETGAGKSIVVEAIGLLLGGRASADLVRTGADSAVVQAMVETTEETEIIVRREVSAQGRSRGFVDDTLCTSAALRDLGRRLVDLHGQHEHQLLLDPRAQADLLDRFAGLEPQIELIATKHARLVSLRDALDRIGSSERERQARLELAAAQLEEIDRVEPKAEEDEALAATRRVLANAERLQVLCAQGLTDLYEGDHAVLGGLARIWKALEELAAFDDRFTPHLEAREAIKSQLEDLAYGLQRAGSDIDAAPEQLQAVEARLAALERLKRRYGNGSLAEVLAVRARLHAEVSDLAAGRERAAEVEAELRAAEADYLATARAISRSRRRAAPELARRLEARVAELAMEQTRCELRITAAADGEADPAAWGPKGFDAVELYLSPNPGEELRPLAQIASGGELSRLMLAVKTLVQADAPGKTLIFDEVDAGIGGRTADVVGRRLRELAETYQVVCVTHLPQIAAYATTHYHVSKHLQGGRTETTVERLAEDRRPGVLARMMTGQQPTDRAVAAAREMRRKATVVKARSKQNTKHGS